MTANEDYWTALAQTPNIIEATTLLDTLTIRGIEPLDAQLGVVNPLSAPMELHDELFPTPDEGYTGPVTRTYAVLDGAKLPGLPECLENSQLEYACLFQGKAADDLRDVAPWIVRLEVGNRFTRNLFTRGKTPWHLWNKDGGIIVRSKAGLDDLRRHFRRFTRVQDQSGAWFYLRFYEPQVARDYMYAIAHDADRLAHWLRLAGGEAVDLLTLTGPSRNWACAREATWFCLSPQADIARPNAPFRIGQLELDVFVEHRRLDFLRRLDAYVSSEISAFAKRSSTDRHARLRKTVLIADRFGVTREKAVADLVLADFLNPLGVVADTRSYEILNADMHCLDKGVRLLERARSLNPS